MAHLSGKGKETYREEGPESTRSMAFVLVRCAAQITLLSVYSSWRKMSYYSLCHFLACFLHTGLCPSTHRLAARG
jgi:hypothetical protein